jgi:hypothetical protein
MAMLPKLREMPRDQQAAAIELRRWLVASVTAAAMVTGVLVPGCTTKEVHYQPSAQPATDPPLVLRAYAVPSGYAQQMNAVLSGVFQPLKEDEKRVARAQLTPDGQLLVLGPEGVHRGVEALMKDMSSRQAPPPPETIEMSYWIVAATPAPTTEISSSLVRIHDVLSLVGEEHGPLKFELIETLRVSSLRDEHAHGAGAFSQVRQRASIQVDGSAERAVIADVDLRVGPAALETRLSLRPDQTVIIGQAGIDTSDFKPLPTQRAGHHTLFYIVRAVVRNAG